METNPIPESETEYYEKIASLLRLWQEKFREPLIAPDWNSSKETKIEFLRKCEIISPEFKRVLSRYLFDFL